MGKSNITNITAVLALLATIVIWGIRLEGQVTSMKESTKQHAVDILIVWEKHDQLALQVSALAAELDLYMEMEAEADDA
jgi:hypothetical protein